MAIDNEILRARIREAFGGDQQEAVAEKLHVSQSTISKVLTGIQQPSLEMIYHVAKEYNVSVDWLLGLVESKYKYSYASATRHIMRMESLGVITRSHSPESDNYSFMVEDPLLKHLIRKCINLSKADKKIYDEWISTKLDMFNEAELVYSMSWENEDVEYYMRNAYQDEHWLKIYGIVALENESFLQEMDDLDAENPFNF